MEKETYPGLHDQVRHKLNLPEFSKSPEEKIIKKLGSEWYVTDIGYLQIGSKSCYKFALIKPVDNYQQMFNFERELVIVFSSYESFEPRTLDAFDAVTKLYQPMRIDKICCVLVSADFNVEEKLNEVLSQGQETQVVVPFHYQELLSATDSYFQRNRFKKYFYSRDLFAYQSPLRKDLYFFGRTDLINRIVNRHLSAENSGLFGLRKSGKTSIVFGIERSLKVRGEKCVVIDCEDTAFHMRRWNQCLYYIINKIVNKYGLSIDQATEDEYTETNASPLFEKEIVRIYKEFGNKSILIIFDEIENITFDKSPSPHWEKGLDFVFFWQSIRAIFQRISGIFTFLLVGTNPMCVEKPTILGKDNPIFKLVPYEYIERFDVPQTREMVRRLGRLMGLKFEEVIYAKLTEDYGGHPFLIRHACSTIHKMCSQERPIEVGRLLYEKARDEFDRVNDDYIEMLLEVLRNFYKDEYDMLQFLALGDYELFKSLALDSPGYVNHLIGYGIISNCGDAFDFRIDSVKKHLVRKHRYEKKMSTNEERLEETSRRRNIIEPKLRVLIRNLLWAKYGPNRAKEIVLNIMGAKKKAKYYALSYTDILNPDKAEIYFDELRKIILKEWSVFEHIFDRDRASFDNKMTIINKDGRKDAHAKVITDDEMSHFRICMVWLEEHVNSMI